MKFTNQTYRGAKRRAYNRVLDMAHILQWAKEHPAGDPDEARIAYFKALSTYESIVFRGYRERHLFEKTARNLLGNLLRELLDMQRRRR